MARYRKVEVKTWNDGKFRDLSPIPPCGQGLWLWFLTGTRTTNIPGVVVGTDQVMAGELRWSVEAFREAFREASAKGMAKGDLEAGLVWLPNASRPGDKRNKPESPNVIRSWRDTWEEIPECSLKLEVWQQLKAFAEAFGQGFAEAFGEACRRPWVKPQGNPSPNQEQEQEQEQEQDSLRARVDSNSGPTSSEKGKVLNGHLPAQTDRARGDDFEQLQRVKSAYPKGSYDQADWLEAQRSISRHIDDLGHTWEQVMAGTQRYAAQQAAKNNLGTQFVKSPKTFFACVTGAPPRFLEEFTVTEAKPEAGGRKRWHPDDGDPFEPKKSTT